MTDKEKVISLNRQRGVVKSQITKLASYLDECDSTDKNKIELEIKLNSIEKIHDKLDNLKLQYIEVVKEDSELQAYLDSISEVEEEAEKIQVRIKKFLLPCDSLNKENNHSSESNAKNVENNHVSLRIPEMSLPCYSGSYQDWYNFKDQFLTLVDSNDKLNDIQKLYYLKSTLRGAALDVVSVDDSYSSLFKALQDRFQNDRYIVDSHINDILNMENSSQDAAKNLRSIVDECQKHIRALKTIGLELNKFTEIMLINIILKKVDRETRKQFELSLSTSELPNWKDFIDFLNKRCLVLENLQNNVNIKPKQMHLDKNPKVKTLFVKNNSFKIPACTFCKLNNHCIYKCEKFLALSDLERFSAVKKLNLCINCLKGNHKIAQCISKNLCSLCSQKHNTLLHRNDLGLERGETKTTVGLQKLSQIVSNKNDRALSANDQLTENITTLCNKVCVGNKKSNNVLLTTCIVYLENAFGKRVPAICLLDSGSQCNFISLAFSELLGIQRNKSNHFVSGINGNTTRIKFKIHTTLSNKDLSFQRPIDFLIINKITEWTPSQSINIKNLKVPSHIKLANPNFGKPEKVDILLGAELFYEILETERYRISQLLFQNTVFGYIATGTVEQECQNTFCGFVKTTDTLEENIQKFWKIESVENESPSLSEEDQYCENHFLATYSRDHTGRFTVSMPLKADADSLGESRSIADRRLKQLWMRLEKLPVMKDLYCQFMKEYEDLDHMTKMIEIDECGKSYYLPHHGVFHPEKPSTPLRTVFNGSSATSNGKSLNDILHKGYVKEELYEIMLRFRKHQYVFLTDIQKMFRQIFIAKEQRKLLKILWKPNISSTTDEFELNTVTYGTVCAPFLATRTIKQLAVDEAKNFPKASEVLLNDCYMDDIITGEDSLDAAKELQHELIKILGTAGMHLHKWNANHLSLLENVNQEALENYTFSENETKALGVTWKPTSDVFTFKVKIDLQENLTKRTILSNISKIYDPLGLIGPVITKAKIFMQDLWKLKLDWNDPIPNSLAQAWLQFAKSLKNIEKLSIDRYILIPNAQKIVLHAFSDASSLAFGVAVYIQSFHNSEVTCNLVGSKSQVAPLKTVTIPRLELSACFLLSKLVVKIIKALNLVIQEVYLYTDSQIALAWINTPPWKLKTFVGNRVAKIQNYTEHFSWKFVPSNQNPADLISRGVDSAELAQSELWFHGPSFLNQETSFPAQEQSSLTTCDSEMVLKEMKEFPSSTKCNDSKNISNEHYSTLTVHLLPDFYSYIFSLTNDFLKLIRILCFVHRFLLNCRNKQSEKMQGPISVAEIKKAEIHLIKQVQYVSFSEDLKNLQSKKNLSGNSKLKYFNPFLDQHGIIRVGGRLKNANLDFDSKHPILLPHTHKLSIMIMEYFHKKFFHLGPQALLFHSRQKYWILNGRSLARKIVHKCIICFKSKPIEANQIMGNLPSERVNPSPPFQNCGIDFCGPFEIKYKNQRKGNYNKIYVALFVCLATKAIHLEIVTDLKSESFIATLKRFFGRRGKSSTIFSDNGTTFIGANNELKKLHALVNRPDDTLVNYLSSEVIQWKFIPPRSPNFGGLWEAGVKSFKFHLKRTLGNSRVTIEEFLTVITQIEGILNSRPLLPLTSDINDLDVLTPAHFLIGRPITAIPEPDLTSVNENRLSHWQKITKMIQSFWKCWKRDYLNHLQNRNKWFMEKDNLKENTLVLLKDENLPPTRWSLGRIIKVKYGSDNKVRVVDVKTATGIVTRAISKICILPI